VLRASSIFGASRATPYLIGEAIDAGVKGHAIEVTDERSNMRQFVHVDDVVEAIRLALTRKPEGAQPVNITGGTYLAELTIAELVREELPELRIRVVRSKDQSGDGEIGPLDLGAAFALLGYAPRADFAQRVRSLARAAARADSGRGQIKTIEQS
jgi:nucleoside-diphosphate-sugar epimerase